MNRDNHLMCEMPATVNVHRAACSSSDADWHFFPNTSPWSLHNNCITNREQTARNVRISNEKRSSRFKQNWSYLIWNNICTRAWKFGMRKSEEWLENNDQASVCLSEKDAWKEIWCMLTVSPLFQLCKGKESSNKINISLVSIN